VNAALTTLFMRKAVLSVKTADLQNADNTSGLVHRQSK
jgi:hypothetical protein